MENGQAWNTLFKTYTENRERHATYRPGTIHVYFPEDTLNYSVSDLNHIDAFNHICDFMMPEELELALTHEIEKVPASARIYVLERTLPLEAITQLEKLGNRVVSQHEFFVDENGVKHPRQITSPDFLATLQSYPEGTKLLDVFRRVEEKASNLSRLAEGATVSTQTELAAANDVLPDRPNKLTNLIDGSVYDGVTFADKEQDEVVVIALKTPGRMRGVFVDYFEGDGQQVPPSRVPDQTTISVSTDGITFKQTAVLGGSGVTSRSRARFAPVEATYVRFDFGHNTQKRGLWGGLRARDLDLFDELRMLLVQENNGSIQMQDSPQLEQRFLHSMTSMNHHEICQTVHQHLLRMEKWVDVCYGWPTV